MPCNLPGQKYETSINYKRKMIAPCGMNCGTCIAFMRRKNKCPGCHEDNAVKNKSCVNCIIINCELLKKNGSGFCYECGSYPCLRLKQLDKRYRTKYGTSFLDNLKMIRENGIESFLAFEQLRRTCPQCGASMSVHRNSCLVCS